MNNKGLAPLAMIPIMIFVAVFANIVSETKKEDGKVIIDVGQAMDNLKEDGKEVWSKVVQK